MIKVKNWYPIPWIDDLLDQLKGAKFFRNIDLKSSYHQVSIEKNDVWNTTFKSKDGLFEWLVMPLDLTNALYKLKGAKFFHNIDLKSICHQVSIEKNDVWNTTFKSKDGLFEWLVMPFGLTNALYKFMWMVDDILWPFINSFVVLYLDDIFIFNKT
jgi:hypothetical protein